MATYTKSSGISGAWVKASELENGVKAKLVSETEPKEGEYGTQNVAKIRFQGETGEAKNVNLNKPTLNALVDAFGGDSKNWIGKLLTARTEQMRVGGKKVTALYLIPEGYSLQDDEGGYLVIEKEKESEQKTSEGKPVPFPNDEQNDEQINPEDIPF